MPEDVAAVLAAVTKGLSGGGEDRPSQSQMAQAVRDAIDSGRHVVVQAGTGTGKSLAYLVPAVLSGKKVVVATATKALQDQLADNDLPAVSRALHRPVDFAVLKGRSNYLCRERANEVGGSGIHQQLMTPSAEAAGSGADDVGTGGFGAGLPTQPEGAPISDPGRLADQVRRIIRWAEHTPTGDRADLDFEPHERAWAMLSVGPRECPGAHRCPEGGRCFAERARQHAAEADVVVVNTHLYGAHLASGGAVLPPHDVVVFDEAHEVEDVMTASLGVELAPGRLSALHAMVRPLLDDGDVAAADLAGLADRLRDLLATRAGLRVLIGPATPAGRAVAGALASVGNRSPEGPPGRERPFFAGPPRPYPGPDPDDAELRALLELAGARTERVRGLLLAADADEGPDAAGPRDGGGHGGRLARALTAGGHLVDDLRRVAAPGAGDVAWVDGSARNPVLRLSPVDVGPVLTASLWGSTTAVLTSATIPPRLTERLGLAGFPVDELDVGSPFDYRARALLYVARHLPDRRRPGAEAAMHGELAALVEAAGGRTLALFTSRRATEAAAEALRSRLPYRLLVQGDLPKGRLLQLFSEEETSCLFATLGFWQGVDVPGRSLSLVTLDRLPFGRPDDPLLQARRERAGPDAFGVVDLPRAATLLAQGVGRLIRSASDAGVVAVLDPRLATAGYRRALLSALPPMRRSVDGAEVARFLAHALEEPAPKDPEPSDEGSVTKAQ